jgi:hypothetical protein
LVNRSFAMMRAWNEIDAPQQAGTQQHQAAGSNIQ